jgi:hypothetical protein
MKKLATVLCLSALATAVYAQGTVNFNNTSTTLVSTNRGGTIGNATGAGAFNYALVTAASTVTTITQDDLMGTTWTFTGLYGSQIGPAGRFAGTPVSTGAATTTGWAAGEVRSFAIVGWSANLAGNSGNAWDTIRNQLITGAWVNPAGFFGVSGRGFGASGGGASGLPSFSLFGAPTAQGTPIGTGFALAVVPEPGTFALLGLGAAGLFIFRRRN